MGADASAVHIGDRADLPDAPWTTLPAETTLIAADERGRAPRETGADPVVVVVRVGSGSETAAERLREVRDRFPDAPLLAYSPADDPDAAIDAGRVGAEYVSGRRLRDDDETLADRVDALRRAATDDRPGTAGGAGGAGSAGGAGGAGGAADESGDDRFLERFVRIVSDRSAELEAKLDALLDLGRERLDLSVGYAARTTEGRFALRRHRGGSELLASLEERDAIDADGSLPLEDTYCRRTVGADGPAADGSAGDGPSGNGSAGDGPAGDETAGEGADGAGGSVVAFTDPAAAGWEGDPAHELFGLGSYIGGRIVVDDEVVGSLCFVDETSRDRPFSSAERLFVELLADWLGRAFERRAAREDREAAVERLEDTLERIDDAFFALDDDWRFTYVNGKAAALLDRPADGLVGANVWDEFPDAVGEAYEDHYRRAMETQEPVSFVDRYEPLDLWTEVTAYPSSDGLSVFFSDVTDRRRREETLERLLRTAERLQRDPDAAAVADRLVDAADEVLGYGISGVRLFDEDDGLLRLVATSGGVGDRFTGREPRAPGEGIVGEVYESGESRVWSDLADRVDDREYHGMRSLIGVPMGDHGVFVVGSLEPDAFDESDVSIVELLATNATATLDARRRQDTLRTYENALKNVDDMVCVLDADGAVTYATAPFAEWLGTTSVALVGRRLSEVLSEPEADRVAAAVDRASGGESGDPEDAGAGEGARTERVRQMEITVGRGDGARERHAELRLSPLSDGSRGVVASLTDTTDLRRTETQLSREQDRFDRLFERLPDPVMEVALEPEQTVVARINSAFASQFGYDPAALRGRSIAALDIDEDRLSGMGEETVRASGDGEAGGRTIDERVREAGFVTAEVRRRTVDGVREFLFRGFAYDTTAGRRAFGIYTDITDRRRRERYFRVVNRILRHNLRNELNVVFGFASEISNETDDERIADYADRIETTGKRLADLAEGAAGIRRVVEEGTVSDPTPVSVGRVAAAVRDEYAERFPEARIDVSVRDDVVVRGDERLEEALGHLVENAVVHSRSDAARVAVTAERNPDAGVVAVRVADDGPGVPDGVRGVITGEMEVTQLTHNTGIGLWIVAWIAEAYGGEVAFGPGIDGEGTTVTLRLPAAR
jgi:PAS domain S-box-containing protein